MQNNKPLMVALSKLVSTNQPDLVLFVGEALVGNDGVGRVGQLQVGTHLCIIHRALNMYFFRRMGGGRRRRTGSRIVATISMAMFTYALDPFLLPLPILSLESTHFFPEQNGKLKTNTTGSEITLLENFSYWTLAFELLSGHYLTNRPITPLFVPTPRRCSTRPLQIHLPTRIHTSSTAWCSPSSTPRMTRLGLGRRFPCPTKLDNLPSSLELVRHKRGVAHTEIYN